MKNCWLNKTPLKMALILMLTVAVPFFLAMFILYIIGLCMLPPAEECLNLCVLNYIRINNIQQLPEEIPDETRPEEIIERYYRAIVARNASNEKPSDLPIAALSEELYSDGGSERVFKCPAAVLADTWALATGECVKSGVSNIRIGSLYWSKSGVVRKIDKILFSDGDKLQLALVGFGKSDVKKTTVGRFGAKEVKSFTWDGSLDVPLKHRKKYQELGGSDLDHSSDMCQSSNNASCFLTRKQKYCGRDLHAPMLDANGTLTGFHVKTLCPANQSYGIVFYINIHEYTDWLYKHLQ